MYGIVYKAEDTHSRNQPSWVALKRCLPHHQVTDGFPVTTLREIQSLRLLRGHPNIVALHHHHTEMVTVSQKDVYLVFEYCEHDLAKLLDYHHHQKYQRQATTKTSFKGGLYNARISTKKASPFSEANVKRMLHQLLSAVAHIHDHRLIHRDIKLSNLLYTTHGQLKVADFGLSRCLPPLVKSSAGGGGDNGLTYNMTLDVVSLWYRPPELLLGSKYYGQGIDIWSCGCVWAELLKGRPQWAGKTEKEQIKAIFTDLGPPTAATWPSFVNMPKVQEGIDIAAEVEESSKKKGIQHGVGKIRTYSRSSSMPLLDAFSSLSTSGLVLLTHLLSYDADNQRLSGEKALESTYFASEPLPTPLEAMPKFLRSYE